MRLRRAFTMVELLVVIAIIAILAAIIFPVFARAKASAKKTACMANLRQVGMAIGLYMTDHDDVFPHAVDAADKFAPEIWNGQPEWQARIPYMPMLHEALQPYCKNKPLFLCPADTGTYVLDNSFPIPLRTSPTLQSVYGSSYFFRTEIAFRFFTSSSFQLPSDVNVLMDGAGHWHGTKSALRETDNIATYLEKIREYRYNVLFGDLHAKSLNYDELQRAWRVDL
ncbi:MAG TPA: prepilin-type N-terminal cleavage/methylation domain-containing protein [Fimbriimonadaceae bacterium]|nr:prepilin-type N-terminal cleavage/methylation domain-containing protein [Fimbriimonadaceae bacterium]